ncbi:50S ribosomal protein L23 [Neoehrlichia mikurensis]|uniref:Large ribosomal subunit protein uL23 n=1 Tax=Neoehrlichia mikurensis TaxID=89586 RepID=A0A9Q9F3Y0_9RICK|nr:50S ribosomal protein L23 [Neoehrlichia mikurensis]QXK91793.1 50S ribosomal protein L23 [Neoehrlichia mikurensis]QXK93006.1 50S ribosomal protein L23 [Neoehrlichia mikurensis]QXK93483.1 50S ribosomal protein L23 [Neoehrlichia mikurensis]UTO55562.1 50S ribosomal protein L23 [Neoehrlichia mikurensis]UTO56483.1 50S ribosomal protein L23 [Neoehrlichia mikurensis]
MINYFSIIKSPIVTEKIALLGEKFNKYALYVDMHSSKSQIKRAIKLTFGVDVVNITSLRLKGKKKRCKGIYGKRRDRKKVYFSLLEGQDFKNLEIK